MNKVSQALLWTHLGLFLVGTLGWIVLGGLPQGALFAFMAGLGALYLVATIWTIKIGFGHKNPRKWLLLLLHFGKLGLLVLVLRGMITRFPLREGALLSGALLHVLSLFLVAIRQGFQRSPQ